jgi:hypothetical protein
VKKLAFVIIAAMLSTSAMAAPKADAAKADNKTASKNVVFKNCKEARAAGYSDMAKGEPGYAPKLDRDKDGIACETSGWNS